MGAWALLVAIPIPGPIPGPMPGPMLPHGPMPGLPAHARPPGAADAILGVVRTGTEPPGEDDARRLQQVARRLGGYLGAVAEIFGLG